MGILGWLVANGFDLQTVSIVGGLLATAISIHANTKQRKVETLLALTASHRELWSQLFDRPQFWRILQDDIDLEASPAKGEEELFVHLVILHVRVAYKARRSGMQFDDDAFVADVRQLFARPMVGHVWKGMKDFQDREFIAFVDRCLRDQR